MKAHRLRRLSKFSAPSKALSIAAMPASTGQAILRVEFRRSASQYNVEAQLEILVRNLEISDRNELGQIRKHAYAAEFGDRVDTSILDWNHNDLLFLNLGAFDSDGKLLSTLRLSTIETAEEFKRVLRLEFDSKKLKLPLMVLSRGATLAEYQSRHLHSLLRMEAITLARQAGMNHVVGGIESGTARLGQLKSIGYEIFETQEKWDGFLKSDSHVSLVVLSSHQFAAATERLQEKIQHLNVTRSYSAAELVLRIKTHSHRISHESVPFGFENGDLWNEVKDFLEKNPPAVRSPAVSGWALQAPPGSENPIHAGWEMDFCPYNGPLNRGPTWTPRDPNEAALKPIQDFDQNTAAMFPKMALLLNNLEARGLVMRRARIIRLAPGSTMKWHQDGSKFIYQARIHIPLKTNSSCFFESEFGQAHFPANGELHFVHINRPHRALNLGNEERYHFVAHVWDTNRFTKHHHYDWRLYDRETHHQDEVDLPSQWSVPQR